MATRERHLMERVGEGMEEVLASNSVTNLLDLGPEALPPKAVLSVASVIGATHSPPAPPTPRPGHGGAGPGEPLLHHQGRPEGQEAAHTEAPAHILPRPGSRQPRVV